MESGLRDYYTPVPGGKFDEALNVTRIGTSIGGIENKVKRKGRALGNCGGYESQLYQGFPVSKKKVLYDPKEG